jgi:xylulokinase
LAEHEPDVFARVARVLLPKDWLRLQLSGEFASEPSDASGTLWLDVGKRAWSDALREATGLPPGSLPRLVEGSEPTGTLLPALARRWGIPARAILAGGAGDQAAGAIGAGVFERGDASIALGTSGVYFVAGDSFAPNPARAVHAFCHALPGRWHQMSVILSAASCLAWVAKLVGARDEAAALAFAERVRDGVPVPIFLPYLSGERTPHNDPHAQGVLHGLTHDTGPGHLVLAVLEGVSFALADGQAALVEAGTEIGDVAVIGGGARSLLFSRILATTLDRPLAYAAAAELGPAFGAARLARLAVTGEAPSAVCRKAATDRIAEPDPALADALAARRDRFRELYPALRSSFH